MTEETKTDTRKSAARLTTSQKAEAAALWRTGTVTLDELSKRFKKRPEAFSRLFKRMGIEKGGSVAKVEEHAKKMVEVAEAKILNRLDDTMLKINAMREDHIRYSNGLSKLAWSELLRARSAGLDIAGLKDLMLTLKIAGDVFANSRKELFTILDVEKHTKIDDLQDLPELTLRELTGAEILQLQNQSTDEMGVEADAGGDMMPDDDLAGL